MSERKINKLTLRARYASLLKTYEPTKTSIIPSKRPNAKVINATGLVLLFPFVAKSSANNIMVMITIDAGNRSIFVIEIMGRIAS